MQKAPNSTSLRLNGNRNMQPMQRLPWKVAAVLSEQTRIPLRALAEFIHSASDWLLSSSKVVLSDFPEQFGRLWTRLISVIRSKPGKVQSSLIRGNREPDWGNEAINSPAGKLTEALMNDPVIPNLKPGEGFPSHWFGRVGDLLALEGDLRRHALVIFGFHLKWFFAIDPVWTQENLISVLDQESEDQNALWSGFFWRAEVPQLNLYERLKPHLLRLAIQKSLPKRGHTEVLPAILLTGWKSFNEETGERVVTNAEMREILINASDKFRSQVLWHLEMWSSGDKDGGWGEELSFFLSNVWPRHNKTKSPKISSRLCDLAFSSVDNFLRIADIILPLVTEINEPYTMLQNLDKEDSDIIDQFPEKTLAILYKVLSENALTWPYGIKDIHGCGVFYKILKTFDINDFGLIFTPSLVSKIFPTVNKKSQFLGINLLY